MYHHFCSAIGMKKANLISVTYIQILVWNREFFIPYMYWEKHIGSGVSPQYLLL